MSLVKNTNMLEGPSLKTIVAFTLPIFFGSVFQQLYNMVDSIVVGKYVSVNALAAVGSTTTISNLLIGVTTGFCTGASIMVAQLVGAHQQSKIKPAISTTLLFLIGVALLLSASGLALSKQIMLWINVPQEILSDSLLYFRIYLVGMLFLTLYNFFAAFLRALGDSVTPLIFLVISSVLNIICDLLFVLGFHMGVAGVAWATVLAQGISVTMCCIFIYRRVSYFRFSRREIVFHKELLGSVLRLGVPAGIQGSIAGLGMVMVQGLINSFGSVSIAAYTAANKMEALCNLPMQSISMSLSVFVGQNVGAGNIARSKHGLWVSTYFSLGMSALLSLVIFQAGSLLMQLFVNGSETDIITVGVRFMQTWAPFIVFHALGSGFIAFLRGVGDSVFSMVSVFCDLFTRMAMAYLFALGLGMGFMGISYAIICGWLACALAGAARYWSGTWKKKCCLSQTEP